MDRSVLVSAITYALFGLATIFTIGRFLSRWPRLRGKGYEADDWIGLLAYACVVGLTVAAYYQLENGLGRDLNALDMQTVERFLIWIYASQHMYVAAVFGTKLSLVLLYIRMWPGRSSFRAACVVLAVALVCALVAFEVVTAVQCLPVSYNWRLFSGPTATCIDRVAYTYSLAGVDIGFNALLLLFPVPKMRSPDLSWLKKAGICAVFLAGLAVTAISAVQVYYLDSVTIETNVTWYYSYIGLYSNIEVYLSQICFCMPTMAAILDRKTHGTSRLSSSSQTIASTGRGQDRESGAVIGIKGIGPSDHDPEKGDLEDGEEYERAPSPTIGLQRRTWETISTISQSAVPPMSPSANRFRQLPSDELRLQTPAESSNEDIHGLGIESDVPLAADLAAPIGIPSIVDTHERVSSARPQSLRLSTDLLSFTRKLSESRLNLHSW